MSLGPPLLALASQLPGHSHLGHRLPWPLGLARPSSPCITSVPLPGMSPPWVCLTSCAVPVPASWAWLGLGSSLSSACWLLSVAHLLQGLRWARHRGPGCAHRGGSSCPEQTGSLGRPCVGSRWGCPGPARGQQGRCRGFTVELLHSACAAWQVAWGLRALVESSTPSRLPRSRPLPGGSDCLPLPPGAFAFPTPRGLLWVGSAWWPAGDWAWGSPPPPWAQQWPSTLPQELEEEPPMTGGWSARHAGGQRMVPSMVPLCQNCSKCSPSISVAPQGPSPVLRVFPPGQGADEHSSPQPRASPSAPGL